MKEITHLIFDFNGTCFMDTMINYRAWSKSVREWFNRDFSLKEYQEYNGRTGYNTVEELFREKNLSIPELQALTKHQEHNYIETCMNTKPLGLTAGLKELVEKAKSRGIEVAICTSATKELMDLFRSLLPVDDLFEEKNIITTNGLFPSKPNPAIFKYAVESLKADSSKCIAFEDTKSGLKSAYDAGIDRVIAITGDNLKPIEPNVPVLFKAKDFFDVISFLNW